MDKTILFKSSAWPLDRWSMFFIHRSPPYIKIVGILSVCRTGSMFPVNSSFLRQNHAGKFLPDVISLNTEIGKCMRNGLVEEAQKLFDETPHRNIVTWNSMIRGYFQNGELDQAVGLFDRMPHRDLFSYNTMIAGLLRYGDVDWAKRVFDEMPVRDVVSWNTMIVGYVHNSMTNEALSLFNEMPVRNAISWNTVMAGLLNSHSFDFVERIFKEMPVRDMASWTIMISALAGLGRIIEARKLFEEMPERDVRVWNAIVAGYIENDRIEVAESLFVKMPERDSNSWYELIDGLVGSQRLKDALRIFGEMPQKSPRSWNSILLGLIRGGLVEEAHAFFEKNPFSDIISWTNMIVGYFELGETDTACKLFEMAPHRDETLWNATIFGLGENDQGEEGLKLFIKMKAEGLAPDHATFTSVLNICSILPSSDFGTQAHGHIIKVGLGCFVAVSNAIITMYARCGSIHSAFMEFSYMPTHDTISWNSIICGFSHHGNGMESLKLFKRMRLTDIKPDQVTFIGVLSACSHTGMIDEGQYYFNFMRYKCFLQPTCEHYTCIVDLLGRYGFVEEAMKFINGMREDGIEASASVWGAMLGACRVHRNMKVGEMAGERVLEMEPWNAGAYMILAEMYMGVGRKRDAERMWVLMKERGAKKQPGCSWIEVKNRVHVFLAGDGLHPEIDRVYGMLDYLNKDMDMS
ncbi:pentatricopeptide repeat-containing protein At4g02750-like [Magnolia sinica]|uniref:pentatricopeptide repeat-containing protein At4g02750-like n=1 Tax=Magnolia sinica TaxID=86752 RepID=UPI0026586F89|nr:pentatricopeptide repeat-containing protein At4g02750-like [Magnolia sinica]